MKITISGWSISSRQVLTWLIEGTVQTFKAANLIKGSWRRPLKPTSDWPYPPNELGLLGRAFNIQGGGKVMSEHLYNEVPRAERDAIHLAPLQKPSGRSVLPNRAPCPCA